MIRCILLLFLVSLATLLAKAQSPLHDEVEQRVYDCIVEAVSLDSLNHDLDSFALFLYTHEYMPSLTGDGFIALYQSIQEKGDISLDANIQLPYLDRLIPYTNLKACYNTLQDSTLTKSQSKPYLLKQSLESLSELVDISPAIVIQKILDVLDSSDFEKPLFRTYALLSWYATNYPPYASIPLPKHIPNTLDNELVFHIDAEEQLYYEDSIITLTALEALLAKEYAETIAAKTEVSKTIVLKVHPSVSMGIIVDIKNICRKYNYLKLRFQVLD